MLIKNAQLIDMQSPDSAGNIFDVHVAGGLVKSVELASNQEKRSGQEKASRQENASRQEKASRQENVIDAEGAALIPGLHDHHIHLLALAEASNSLDFSGVKTSQEFAQVLQSQPSSFIRGIGYHEHIAGELNRQILDELVPDKSVRIQHRTGALWILNSRALKEHNISSQHGISSQHNISSHDGRILRQANVNNNGNSTAQIFSLKKPEELSQVFQTLNQYGVTGATDATPGYAKPEVELFQQALQKDSHCDLTLMLENGMLENGMLENEIAKNNSSVSIGAKKILLDDFNPPEFSDLAELVATTHEQNRSVAIHSVTRASLAMCVAVFNEVGVLNGDRIEHASVAPPELIRILAKLGIRIVTQPNFIFERGDEYLLDVPKEDQEHLYRCQGWLDAGVGLAGGTDAPFGSENPWVGVWSAMNRTTYEGKIMNSQEKLSFIDALKLFLSHSNDPGGKAREIKVGEPANLCLLNSPLADIAKTQPTNPVSKCIYKGEVCK